MAADRAGREPVRRTRIKFCGLTRIEDVRSAVALGVDAIGLVFDPASRRAVAPDQARALREVLPPFVMAAALFRNASEAVIRAVIEAVDPDLLQFHGEEPPEACSRWGRRYLKAVPMAGGPDLGEWRHRYASAAALLLDAHAPGASGGTGQVFDWSRIPTTLDKVVLAGGLHPGNVGAAVTLARPFAVDVSSGIESAPGLKDAHKMSAFVAAVRRADASDPT